VSKLKEKITEIKGLLAQRFKLRDLESTLFLLGAQIDRKRSACTLHLSQRQYTLDLLDRFGFADCRPPARASTCPSALRRLRTTGSCATSRT
jgi:hypothetical protein